MKSKLFALFTAGFLLATAPTMAACPAPQAGDTPEAVRANQQRLICLQQELAAKADERQYEVEIDTINQSLDRLQLQRKMDSLDFTPPQF
jgi:hypothetical protein